MGAHQKDGAVAALWKSRAGDAKVETYNCGGGAAYYIAKMCPYEDAKYDNGWLGALRPPAEIRSPLVQ
jgi:hypothetical protein